MNEDLSDRGKSELAKDYMPRADQLPLLQDIEDVTDNKDSNDKDLLIPKEN